MGTSDMGAYGKCRSCLTAFPNSKSHMTNVAKSSKKCEGCRKAAWSDHECCSFLLKQLQELSHTHFLLHTAHDNRQMTHTNIYTRKHSKHTHTHTRYACVPQFLASYCKSLNFHLRWHARFLNPCTCETLKTCRINSKIHNSLFFPFLKEGLSSFLGRLT